MVKMYFFKNIFFPNLCAYVKCNFSTLCKNRKPMLKMYFFKNIFFPNLCAYHVKCTFSTWCENRKWFIKINFFKNFFFSDLCANIKCNFGARCENGRCVCPVSCPDTNNPVCASNGQTFSNECEMDMFACKQLIELEVRSTGECDEMSGSGTGRILRNVQRQSNKITMTTDKDIKLYFMSMQHCIGMLIRILWEMRYQMIINRSTWQHSEIFNLI